MKTIKIQRLYISNFKGIKSMTLDFQTENDIEAFFFGANGSFKTSINDAFKWCLTGKDSEDKEDFNIKNTIDISLNRADHEVKVVLDVDGAEWSFKRVLRENWTKPKGQEEEVLQGNKTFVWVNDAPIPTLTEYNKKVNEIVPEKTFKAVSNPNYFNSLDWQIQRGILNEMTGNLSDKDIAAGHPEFDDLIDKLTGKNLAMYKAEVNEKKKILNKDLAVIPIQIAEVLRNTPEELNFTEIEAEIDSKKSTIADIDSILLDNTIVADQLNKEKISKMNKIHALETEITNLVNEIKTNQATERNKKVSELNEAKGKKEVIEADINSKKTLIQSTEARIVALKQKKADLLKRWYAIDEEVIVFEPGAFVCPTCERVLSSENQEAKKKALEENFNNNKLSRLEDIEAQGVPIKGDIKTGEELIERLKKQVIDLNLNLKVLEDSIKEKTEALDSKPVVDPEFPALLFKRQELEKLKATEAEPVQGLVDVADLTAKKAAVQLKIDELNKRLALKEQRAKDTKRVNELTATKKSLGVKVSELEKIEYSILKFTQFKIAETSKRLEGLFKDVTFKMYNQTLEGNLVDTCEVMYKGVPFKSLNTAGKIWAGLRIIEGLITFYQIKTPIFIDNRESVTVIPPLDTQIVNFVVSPEDKELRLVFRKTGDPFSLDLHKQVVS